MKHCVIEPDLHNSCSTTAIKRREMVQQSSNMQNAKRCPLRYTLRLAVLAKKKNDNLLVKKENVRRGRSGTDLNVLEASVVFA